MRRLGILFIALLLLAAGAPARAADKVQRTVKLFTDGAAAECRRLAVTPNDVCTAIGGTDVSEAHVAEYERSWVHRALALQRVLDDQSPLVRELVPHTHNSFNSSAYPPTFTDGDPNQLYSMRDQLRMDMRGIEMDIHKFPPLTTDGVQVGDVVLCHGEPEAVGPVIFHFGCTNDRKFTEGLVELRDWLNAPANRNEVVLLYLENNLDGDVAAHDRAAADLAAVLGPLVYRPADHHAAPCAPMPLNVSRYAMRAEGHRVLIVGNCGPGTWGTWVYERGPLWDESSSPVGSEYPDYPQCLAERSRAKYLTHWIRWYEDSTWLSNTVDGTGLGGPSEMTLTDTRRMVRCGVNMPGFDQLTPQDPRIEALVWSWAKDEPRAGAGGCAAQGADGRFRARSCGDRLPIACVDGFGGWRLAVRRCPRGTRFSVPGNGFENQRLLDAKQAAHVPDAFVAYRDLPGRGWSLV